jgi:flagellar basal body-associated protein FliL
MSTEAMPTKPKYAQKVINIILIFINVVMSLCAFSVSTFMGFKIHERVVIVLAALLLTVFMVVKEFKVKLILKRVYLNLVIYTGFLVIFFYVYKVW